MEEAINKPITLKKLFNPTSDDFSFAYNSASYIVKAGASESFVSHIAVLGAKKLAEREAITNNKDEVVVLGHAYLENSDPEVVAKNLGINLEKVREEAMTKEKEKSRVVNLEAQVAEQNKKIDMLLKLQEAQVDKEIEKKEAIDIEEVDKETIVLENAIVTGEVNTDNESMSYEAMSWNELKKLASEKGFYKPEMKKEDILKELNKSN